jgi:23S rRNA pseudouridine1911/1915/1917 synthase
MEEAKGIQSQPGAIGVLYEDDRVVALDKPAGQLVHPTGQTLGNTLANYVAYYFQQQGQGSGVHPVHRLDRDTSGCILFAKDPGAQYLLEQQLQARQVNRIYWALVQGVFLQPTGKIEAPIGPHPRLPNRRQVDSRGEAAATCYQVLRQFVDTALVELTLETGRTHQIRLHLAHRGHPVIGDGMYGVPGLGMNRQALHAVELGFRHLATGEEIKVKAPLPTDFSLALKRAAGSPAGGDKR